jgi:hypothetical protein
LKFQRLLSFLTRAAQLLSGHRLDIYNSGNSSSRAWFFDDVLPALHAGGFTPRAIDLRIIVPDAWQDEMERLLCHPLILQCPNLNLPLVTPTTLSRITNALVDWLHHPLVAAGGKGIERTLIAWKIDQPVVYLLAAVFALISYFGGTYSFANN